MPQEFKPKPPLGIEPNWLWNERRMWDLIATIQRYKDANLALPHDETWLKELHLRIDLYFSLDKTP